MRSPSLFVLALLVTILDFVGDVRAEEPGYGDLSGEFVFDGEPPERTVLVRKGDPDVKDSPRCADRDILDESLLVNPKSRGIANVFVYLRKAPAVIHPDLKAPPKEEITVRFDGCRLEPHALFARTNQTIRWKETLPHSPHPYPVRNVKATVLVTAKDDVVLESYSEAETIPIPVKCDIHPWERANWLILDHPYAAITDAKGLCRIEKLPAGEHTFTIWHERCGWVEKQLPITIETGKTAAVTRKISPKRFEER